MTFLLFPLVLIKFLLFPLCFIKFLLFLFGFYQVSAISIAGNGRQAFPRAGNVYDSDSGGDRDIGMWLVGLGCARRLGASRIWTDEWGKSEPEGLLLGSNRYTVESGTWGLVGD